METEIHMSRTIAEAMEWLRKMGIDAKPALPSHKMYEFEYDNVMMLISTDLPNDQIQISCPFYLVAENEVSNKETFEIVKDIVKDELNEFCIEYVGNGLAFIEQVWIHTKKGNPLRKYQLHQMLKEISKAYNIVLAALALVTSPIEMWGVENANVNE